MSAVERLAVALRHVPLLNWITGDLDQNLTKHAADILAADPDLAADIELGAAWRRAEAAHTAALTALAEVLEKR